MSKYVIHACPQRMWYVEEYLVPSIKSQGIEDVTVKCDYKRVGNLMNCIDIFKHITQPGGTWHLQDDVVVCRDFKERTEECNPYDIVCGFVMHKDGNVDKVGYVKPQDMWWSFPCIYIPNNIAREFVRWIEDVAKYKSIYIWMIREGKYDDTLFKEFLTLYYPNYKILNLKPNLIDHVDYLLGGSVVNKQRKNKDVRAVWFEDMDLVEDLEERIMRKA